MPCAYGNKNTGKLSLEVKRAIQKLAANPIVRKEVIESLWGGRDDVCLYLNEDGLPPELHKLIANEDGEEGLVSGMNASDALVRAVIDYQDKLP